jgi:hypothetical protein
MEEKEALKDASSLYEVERRARYAERPGFRISTSATFLVLQGIGEYDYVPLAQ